MSWISLAATVRAATDPSLAILGGTNKVNGQYNFLGSGCLAQSPDNHKPVTSQSALQTKYEKASKRHEFASCPRFLEVKKLAENLQIIKKNTTQILKVKQCISPPWKSLVKLVAPKWMKKKRNRRRDLVPRGNSLFLGLGHDLRNHLGAFLATQLMQLQRGREEWCF